MYKPVSPRLSSPLSSSSSSSDTRGQHLYARSCFCPGLTAAGSLTSTREEALCPEAQHICSYVTLELITPTLLLLTLLYSAVSTTTMMTPFMLLLPGQNSAVVLGLTLTRTIPLHANFEIPGAVEAEWFRKWACVQKVALSNLLTAWARHCLHMLLPRHSGNPLWSSEKKKSLEVTGLIWCCNFRVAKLLGNYNMKLKCSKYKLSMFLSHRYNVNSSWIRSFSPFCRSIIQE